MNRREFVSTLAMSTAATALATAGAGGDPIMSAHRAILLLNINGTTYDCGMVTDAQIEEWGSQGLVPTNVLEALHKAREEWRAYNDRKLQAKHRQDEEEARGGITN